ncbi:MAG: thioredoxin family protein [Flavobacteriaceae bacterium]
MANTPSNMLALGTSAPEFELTDVVSDKKLTLKQRKGSNGTVIMFICNHCPFVIHVNKALVRLAQDYQPKGINFIAISSNDVKNYPQDAPHLMKQVAQEEGYPFPYLYDPTQEVANNYDAACTPDFYLFNADLKLVYRGQLDNSRPGNGIPVTGKDLRAAMEAILTDSEVSSDQKPSIGCSIKWATESS